MVDDHGGDLLSRKRILPYYQFWLSYYLLKGSKYCTQLPRLYTFHLLPGLVRYFGLVKSSGARLWGRQVFIIISVLYQHQDPLLKYTTSVQFNLTHIAYFSVYYAAVGA